MENINAFNHQTIDVSRAWFCQIFWASTSSVRALAFSTESNGRNQEHANFIPNI